jgi:signal transduction histidine kinase
VENRLGIKTTREIETDIFLPSYIQHEVWRIINEALNNAIKHASAAHVHVQISCNHENLRVSIHDDGVGFDTEDYAPGMGLMNMRARAEALNGSLEITSKPGQGTQILFKIPTGCLDSVEGE